MHSTDVPVHPASGITGGAWLKCIAPSVGIFTNYLLLLFAVHVWVILKAKNALGNNSSKYCGDSPAHVLCSSYQGFFPLLFPDKLFNCGRLSGNIAGHECKTV